MYYKKNLEQWFKLKRKREFGLLKKKSYASFQRHRSPFANLVSICLKEICL